MTPRPGTPRPRRRPQQKRSQETVRAILQAAAEVLVTHGYGKATTNRIAARAGVSIGSLYHYFPGKQAVYAALIDHTIAETTTMVIRESGSILANSSLHRSMRDIIGMAVSLVRKNELFTRAVLTGIPGVNQMKALHQVEERVIALIPLLQWPEIERLKRRKGERFEAFMNLFLSMGSSAILRIALDPPTGVSREAMIDELAKTLSRLVR